MGEPGEPAGHVHDERGRHQVEEVLQSPAEESSGVPRARPHRAQRADIPHHDHDPDRRQQVEAGPLDRAGQAQADRRRQEPRPPQQQGSGAARGPIGEAPGQALAHPLPVPDEAVQGATREQADEVVEEGDPGLGDPNAVDGQEEARQAGQER